MFRIFIRLAAGCLLLGGCATFQAHPVRETAIIAVGTPIALAAVVPWELIHIADDQARLARRPYPANEQPMFGEIAKTPKMIAADEKFLADSDASGITRAQASDKAVALGWQYFFQKKDIATAMKRFNQAWLLDPDNGDAFHGFAILMMARDHDAVRAEELFREGLAKPRQSPGIYLDFGRFLVMAHKPEEALAPLQKALTIPDMGPDAEALLVLALKDSGNQAEACAESAKVQNGAQAAIRAAIRDVCRR